MPALVSALVTPPPPHSKEYVSRHVEMLAYGRRLMSVCQRRATTWHRRRSLLDASRSRTGSPALCSLSRRCRLASSLLFLPSTLRSPSGWLASTHDAPVAHGAWRRAGGVSAGRIGAGERGERTPGSGSERCSRLSSSTASPAPGRFAVQCSGCRGCWSDPQPQDGGARRSPGSQGRRPRGAGRQGRRSRGWGRRREEGDHRAGAVGGLPGRDAARRHRRQPPRL